MTSRLLRVNFNRNKEVSLFFSPIPTQIKLINASLMRNEPAMWLTFCPDPVQIAQAIYSQKINYWETCDLDLL